MAVAQGMFECTVTANVPAIKNALEPIGLIDVVRMSQAFEGLARKRLIYPLMPKTSPPTAIFNGVDRE